MSSEQHMTETDLAERWKISVRTLQKWREDGIGVPYIDIGASPRLKTIRYRMPDVLAYEESRLNVKPERSE